MKKLLAVLIAASMLFSLSSYFICAQAAGLDYLLLGDSIAAGAGVINPDEGCYGRIVADTNGYGYANEAISGAPSSALLSRLQLSSVQAEVKKAEIISISIGGNDYLESNWIALLLSAMSEQKMFDRVQQSFSENFAKIIQTIRSLNPNATILVQTIYNPRVGKSFESFVQMGVSRLNAVYRSYLSAHPGSYTIVDVGSALTGRSSLISLDGIHPNAEGNVEIARVILRTLRALGLGTRTEPVIVNPGISSDGFWRKLLAALFN
ncbi:MAG: hypothetical protein IK080_08835 [Clostridia bacterium]|nr:hypothetical protein [Clostridia bacterium]